MPARIPYCVAERCNSGISSGRPRTTITPSTAVNEIEEAMSSVLAPVTGATAAAGLPKGANGGPEQDGDDDGFDIGMADEGFFKRLDRDRDQRHHHAKPNTPEHRGSFRDRRTGEPGVFR